MRTQCDVMGSVAVLSGTVYIINVSHLKFLMTGCQFVFITSFPPLWSCCVYDKRVIEQGGGCQRRVELARRLRAGSHQASASEEMIDTRKLMLLLCVYVYHPQFTDNSRKMSEVNMGKRKEKCENCTKQVTSWICVSALC